MTSEESPQLDASAVPEYLRTTHELVAQLNRGANPVEAVVSAIAALELLIRIPPDNGTVADGFIGTGALEAKLPSLPVTRRIVRSIERTASDTAADYGVYALAALRRVGVVINVSAALEELIQILAARVDRIEQGHR